MSDERQASVAYTDQERLEQFLVYLPEVSVRDFAYQISIFPHYYKGFATAYSEYRRNIQESVVFVFADSRTQEAYVAFNAAIDALYVFSLACLSKLHPGDDLLDEIYHPENESTVIPPDDPKEMMDELNALAVMFLSAYESLLGIAIGGIKEAAEKSGSVVGAITKGKARFTLPSFNRTEWPNVSIRFMDERNTVTSDGKETKPINFEQLGCMDGRTGRPDDTWEFLLELAQGQGRTAQRPKHERETFKKRKQKLTDILRNTFKNDTDPFETDRDGAYRAKFHIEYPHPDNTIVVGANDKFADIHEVFGEMTAPIDGEDGEFSQ
ncbi:MAG: hypothetical protein WC217_01550 [Candidatus Paceibacterota bacterium]